MPIVSPATKMKRQSSYDVLQNLAGPDSSLPLPLPKRDGLEENGIREGVPMTFGVSSVSPTGVMFTTWTTPVNPAFNFEVLMDAAVADEFGTPIPEIQ